MSPLLMYLVKTKPCLLFGHRHGILLLTFGADIFRDGFLMDNRLIEPPTARKIVTVIAVSRKNPASNITAQSAVTVYINRLIFRYFTDALPQRIQWNVNKAVYFTAANFCNGSYIKKRYASVTRQTFNIVPKNCFIFPVIMFSATKPSILTGSFALPKGGA